MIATERQASESEVRFIRAIHDHGLAEARGWFDSGFERVSQTRVAAEVGLSRPTVSGLAQHARRVLAGKPGAGLALDPRKAGIALGVDFGQAHHRVALADIHGQLFEPSDPARYATAAPSGKAYLSLEWAEARIRDLLSEAGFELADVRAVGVSLAGAVDHTTGKLHESPDGMDRSWEIVDIDDELTARLSIPRPTIESDSNASALAEHIWGAARGSDHALYVKVSQRCACGLLLNQRIYRGADGFAGKLGMTTALDADGTETSVLVEDVFSLAAFRKGDRARLKAVDIVEEAKTDKALDAALRRGARALGVALAPIIDVLNPGSVVIGGALGTASLAWVASDLVEGIAAGGQSAARTSIAGRLKSGKFTHGTAVRGAIANALIETAPPRIAAALAGD